MTTVVSVDVVTKRGAANSRDFAAIYGMFSRRTRFTESDSLTETARERLPLRERRLVLIYMCLFGMEISYVLPLSLQYG